MWKRPRILLAVGVIALFVSLPACSDRAADLTAPDDPAHLQTPTQLPASGEARGLTSATADRNRTREMPDLSLLSEVTLVRGDMLMGGSDSQPSG